MQVNGNVYDVRFFGGHHMRANIEKLFIRPISTTLQSLQVSFQVSTLYFESLFYIIVKTPRFSV